MTRVLVVVAVVAVLVLVFYAMRAKAETLPTAPEAMPPIVVATPEGELVAKPLATPTMTFERTAEEEWRAQLMRAAQDYQREAEAFVFNSPTWPRGSAMVLGARALALAAAMESRAQMRVRYTFATPPPSLRFYPTATRVRAAYEALSAAIAAPLVFRPELAIVPIPGGELVLA